MIVYRVAVLAGCLIAGMVVGDLLGVLVGVEANVGGVGFAMLLLIVVTDRMRRAGKFPPLSEQGVLFWSAMYIPIVVAMASIQNVTSAVSGGPLAITVGVGVTLLSAACVPLLSRIGERAEPLPPLENEEV